MSKVLKIHPLTTAQRAIWIGQTMEPDNSAYNVAVRLDIKGQLDLPLFEQAIVSTAQKADSLNSFYIQSSDETYELFQHIHDQYLEHIEHVDLRDSLDPEYEIKQWTKRDLAIAIDLSRDALFCFCLFHCANNQYVLYFRCHHIALDAYGLALIIQGIEQSYNQSLGSVAGSACSFVSQEYVINDEEKYNNSEHNIRDRAFWHQYMSELDEVVSFVAQSTFPSSIVFRNDFLIQVEQVKLIEQLAAHFNTNNAFIVLTAVAVYLSQVTCSQEIVLGIPMMGRMSQKSLMVPTTQTNIVPLRLCFSKNTVWSQCIELVIQQMLTIKNHQYYRAEILRQELKRVGRNRRLVGPTFNIDVFPNTALLKNCETEIKPLSTGPINDFAVTLKMKKKNGTIPLIMMANSRSYDEELFLLHANNFYDFLGCFLNQVTRSLA